MRMLGMVLIICINFILQTTLFHYLSIQGIFPNTALIFVVCYALLRGSVEGAMMGFFTGFLFDTFFGMTLGFYIIPYTLFGYIFGRLQKDFYRENYFLPVFFSVMASVLYEAYFFCVEWLFRGTFDILFLLLNVLLPITVYTAWMTLPIYRIMFGFTEHHDAKAKYKYR